MGSGLSGVPVLVSAVKVSNRALLTGSSGYFYLKVRVVSFRLAIDPAAGLVPPPGGTVTGLNVDEVEIVKRTVRAVFFGRLLQLVTDYGPLRCMPYVPDVPAGWVCWPPPTVGATMVSKVVVTGSIMLGVTGGVVEVVKVAVVVTVVVMFHGRQMRVAELHPAGLVFPSVGHVGLLSV